MSDLKYSWEISKFDTAILGIKTAKIQYLDNPTENIEELIEELKRNKVIYVTYRINAANLLTIQLLEKNKFVLVDGIVALEIGPISEVNKISQNIRQAKLSDIEELEAIGESVFLGVSRYYNDPIIPTIKANEIYKKWIANSVKKEAADMTLVWEENKQILGFVTYKKDGQIPLIGVVKGAQGKGIGKALILAVLNEFKKSSLRKAIIETQVTNISALRLYLSCGFKPVNSYLTFRRHFQTK